MTWIQHKKYILAAAFAVLPMLFAVGCTQIPLKEEIQTTAVDANLPSSITTTQSPVTTEEISITSLADWEALNNDGAFPADGNCYALINGLVHFGGKPDLADRYPELKTIKISNYIISRDADGAFLYFAFTVTESGLDTLPTGNYRTKINPVFANGSDDAHMQILQSDATGRIPALDPDRASAKMLRSWLYTEWAWDCYRYGLYNDTMPADYIVNRYGENGMLPIADFVDVMQMQFGISRITEEDVRENVQIEVIDGKEYVLGGERGGAVMYDIVGLEFRNGTDILTVQYYNDINKLIKSYKVAYTIADGERFADCVVVGESAYTPFGADALFMYQYRRPNIGTVTIDSLADWNRLDYDGQFSSNGNCYALINGLVHFGGGADLAERYSEFETVKISEYTIRREKDEKLLYFDFAVVESGLDTLPVGKYKTTVNPFWGPQSDDAALEILECDVADRIRSVADVQDSKTVLYLAGWFFAELAWDMGDYGAYDTSVYSGVPYDYLAHYIEWSHVEGGIGTYGSYTLDELNALTKDKFGVEVSAENPYVQQNTDADGKIRLYAGYAGFAFVYDIVDLVSEGDADIITVQHYADINRLIKSVKVAYRIGDTGRIYGCELIEDAKYAPFGALYAVYKYKGWEPME